MKMKLPILPALLAAAMMLFTGCQLPEFRATPFVAQRERPDPDRVNLWPLVYAQYDVMSACFNLYSHSDEHIALHPFFSAYSDQPNSPYTSYSTLCGFNHLDTSGKGSSWIPPFWCWHGEDGSLSHMLFPLWVKNDNGFYSWFYYENDNSRGVPFLIFEYQKGNGSWSSLPLLTVYDSSKEHLVSLPLLTICEFHPGQTDVAVLLGLGYHYSFKESDEEKSQSWFCLPLLSGGKYMDQKDGSHDYIDVDLLGFYYTRDTLDVKAKDKGRTYRRYSILWKFWDWREVDGDISLDCLPCVTYNSGRDGSVSFSFLWRLYRYACDADGGKKLDMFFIPFLRP